MIKGIREKKRILNKVRKREKEIRKSDKWCNGGEEGLIG